MMALNLTGFRYCPRCGRSTLQADGPKAVHCDHCGYRYFHNVAVAVSLLLQVDGQLLLTRRARDPAAGLLDFPGGFVDQEERLEEALRREVAEELGLAVDPAALSYGGSGHNRYRFEEVTYLTADVFFSLELPERPVLRCADDVAAAEWYPLDAIPDAELAFPIVADTIRELRKASC